MTLNASVCFNGKCCNMMLKYIRYLYFIYLLFKCDRIIKLAVFFFFFDLAPPINLNQPNKNYWGSKRSLHPDEAGTCQRWQEVSINGMNFSEVFEYNP